MDLARRVGPDGHVVGMDSAADVIEQAREGARTAGLANVTFVVGDAMTLGYDDGSFDVVHAHQVLQHHEIMQPNSLQMGTKAGLGSAAGG